MHVPAACEALAEHEAEPHAPVGKVHAPLAAPVHVPAHSFVPAHAACPVCGALPVGNTAQVPGLAARSQASHEPVQARSQHTPSGEQVVPDRHPPATEAHFCPGFALHSPALSQVPSHLPGSSAFFTATQLPLLQVWQVPGQSLRWVHPTQVLVEVLHLAAVPPHWLSFVHCTHAPVVGLHAVAERPLHS